MTDNSHLLSKDELSKYKASVEKLLDLALSSTGRGAGIAAEILLCANDAPGWRLSISDFSHLDQPHYEAALAVIHGRYMKEGYPSEKIEDGQALFDKMWRKWKAEEDSASKL